MTNEIPPWRYTRQFFLKLFGDLEKWDSKNVVKWSKLYKNGKFIKLGRDWPFLNGIDISNFTKKDCVLLFPTLGIDLFNEIQSLKFPEHIISYPIFIWTIILHFIVSLLNWFVAWIPFPLPAPAVSLLPLNIQSNLEDVLKSLDSIENDKSQPIKPSFMSYQYRGAGPSFTHFLGNFENDFENKQQIFGAQGLATTNWIYGTRGIGQTRFAMEMMERFKREFESDLNQGVRYYHFGAQTKEKLEKAFSNMKTIVMDLKNGDFETQKWELEWLPIECFLGIRLFILYFCPKKSFKKCLERLEQFYFSEPNSFIQLFDIVYILNTIAKLKSNGSHEERFCNWKSLQYKDNLKLIQFDANLNHEPPSTLHLIIDEIHQVEKFKYYKFNLRSIFDLLFSLKSQSRKFSMFFNFSFIGSIEYLNKSGLRDLTTIEEIQIRHLSFDSSKDLVFNALFKQRYGSCYYGNSKCEEYGYFMLDKMTVLCGGNPRLLEFLIQLFKEEESHLKSISFSNTLQLFIEKIKSSINISIFEYVFENNEVKEDQRSILLSSFTDFDFERDSKTKIIAIPSILTSILHRDGFQIEGENYINKVLELNNQIIFLEPSSNIDDISLICLNYFASKLLVSSLLNKESLNSYGNRLNLLNGSTLFRGGFSAYSKNSTSRKKSIQWIEFVPIDEDFKIETTSDECELEKRFQSKINDQGEDNTIGFQFNGKKKLMNGVLRWKVVKKWKSGEISERDCLIWIDFAFSKQPHERDTFNESDFDNSFQKLNKIKQKFPKQRHYLLILSNKNRGHFEIPYYLTTKSSANSNKQSKKQHENIILITRELAGDSWNSIFGEMKANLMELILQNHFSK